MNNLNNSISLIELLQNEKKVEIPIIQRDYAQGRKEEFDILNNFLIAIESSLTEEKVLELDFIYGSSEMGAFQPLDGQQRLTTLFLLHWYASLVEGKLNEDKELLNCFSYETRISSREFIKSLISTNDIVPNAEITIKNQIIDSKWFFLSWHNDQTIESMLRAIDVIESRFKHINNLYALLFNKKLVRFYNINLKNIGLTDDLYIKMNARGKLLTPFENFKASLERRIIENGFEIDMSHQNTFAFNIDTKWADYFWENYRSENNKIDDSIMNLFSSIVMLRLSIERKEGRIALIKALQDNPNNLKSDLISKETFQYLFKVLNLYSGNDLKIELVVNFFRHTPEKGFFNQIVDINQVSSYTSKILFFAQTEYLLKTEEINQTSFNDWMRVIRNLVSQGNVVKGGKRPDIIRSPETFDGMLNLVSELSIGCEDIYSHLGNNLSLNSAFSRSQIIEEKAKAKLILQNKHFKESVFKMEDIVLFKGKIAFAFDCCNYDFRNDEVTNFNIDWFNEILLVFTQYFNNNEIDISNDIRRALLTIDINGQYFYEYWWSFWNVADVEKRCLIENFNEMEYFIYHTDYSGFLKKLIQELAKTNLESYLINYECPENMPNWKSKLIKDKNWLDDSCKSRYIAIDNINKKCYLLRSKRPRDMERCVVVE